MINGGFGLFSGGNPNVWISNNFSNTGNLLGSVNCTPTSPAATCGNALTTVQGRGGEPGGAGGEHRLGEPRDGQHQLPRPRLRAALGVEGLDRRRLHRQLRRLGLDRRRSAATWATTGACTATTSTQTVQDAVLWQDLQTLGKAIGTAPDGRPIFQPEPRRARHAHQHL